MDINITISTPILITGQSFRYRYRDLPSGTFSGYATTTTQVISLTGLTDNTEYEIETEFYDGTSYCPVTTTVFKTAENVACPVFSGEIKKGGAGYYLRISYTGVVGYPLLGYDISWQQGTLSGNLSFPTSLPVAGYIDIPLANSDDVYYAVYSTNALQSKICQEQYVNYLNTCTGISAIAATIASTGSNTLWVITLSFVQSSPITTASTITYVQTDGIAAGTVSGLIGSGTSYSFTIFVPSYIGLKPDFNGTMTDACGNVISWSV